jgi:hypothetical protein
MFTCHRHAPPDQLDWPHALGTETFHESDQSQFVTLCCCHRRRLLAIDESCRIFEPALERVRRSYRLTRPFTCQLKGAQISVPNDVPLEALGF